MEWMARREVLLPTWRGWVLIFTVSAGLAMTAFFNIYGFLAISRPITGGDLVVEGWMPDYALEQAITEFKRNSYRKMYVTGPPLERGAPLIMYQNYADLSAAILRSKGMAPNLLQAIPTPPVMKDRTYASAIALKNWQREHGVTPLRLHIMSLGPHARRTLLIYEKAFGEQTAIGITAIDRQDYDSRKWWISGAGVRAIVDEFVAYCYARLLFWP